jgi:type I restriction enzyme, S subunit
MSLPHGWADAALLDVVNINPPNPDAVPSDDMLVSFVPMALVEELSGRLDPSTHRRWRDVKKGFSRFQEGDVVIAKITPSMENGKAAVAQGLAHGVGAGTTELHVLRPRAGVEARYLLHYILQEGFRRRARGRMTGTAGQLRVPTAFLEEQRIPLPPVAEQLRIVETLDSLLSRLDAAVVNLERVRTKLKAYRASVLKAAVEGRLVPTEADLAREEGRSYEPADVLLERILNERRHRWEAAALAKMKEAGKAPKDERWKAAYVKPVAPDARHLPSLPKGWCWATVEQLASDAPRAIQSGPFGSNLLHSEFTNHGKLVIGIDNVQDGYFSMGSEHRISEDKFVALEHYRARGGDVLVTVMATVGRTCVVPEEVEPAIVTKHVYRITVDRSIVMPQFLHLALWGGPIVRKQMFGSAIGQTRPGLNGGILRRLAIPLPPLTEQSRVVDAVERLSSFRDYTLDQLEHSTHRLSRLRQSVLKWAFEGTLVDQDPADEPADAVLARAERVVATPSKARRSRKLKAAS